MEQVSRCTVEWTEAQSRMPRRISPSINRLEAPAGSPANPARSTSTTDGRSHHAFQPVLRGLVSISVKRKTDRRGLRCHGSLLGRKIYILGNPPIHAWSDNVVSDAKPSQLPSRTRVSIGDNFSHSRLSLSPGRRRSQCLGKRSWRVAALGGHSLSQRHRYGVGSRPRGCQARNRASRERWLAIIGTTALQEGAIGGHISTFNICETCFHLFLYSC
jgi:hypothetical protein